MWPETPTAILVIHGIGQQNPFDTLDAFVRSFWAVLQETSAGGSIEAQHKVVGRGSWVQNYVSLAQNTQGTPPIDFYEYYWAHETERQIDLDEIIEWLRDVSDGARKYYEENQHLVEFYEGQGVDIFDKQGKVKKHWYLKHVGLFLRVLTLLRIPKIPYVDPTIRALMAQGNRLVVDYLGDIALYTTMDVKSRRYQIRNNIITGCLNELETLLQDGRYAQVFVVGHSLGSVIAFDTLNRLNNAMNIQRISPKLAPKVRGLVTFGSPLDKIAFFFRDRTEKDQYVKRQILAHYHGFKARDLSLTQNEKEVRSSIQRYLDPVRWLNFWDPKDPISGHLDFYNIPPGDNIRLDQGIAWGAAHTAYWMHRPMYQRIGQEFFTA